MKKSYDAINTFVIGLNLSNSREVHAYPIITDIDGFDRRDKWGDRPAIVRAAVEAAKLSKNHNTEVQVWTLGEKDKTYDWRGECVRHVLTLRYNAVTFMKRTLVRTHECEEYEVEVINKRDIELMRLDGLDLP